MDLVHFRISFSFPYVSLSTNFMFSVNQNTPKNIQLLDKISYYVYRSLNLVVFALFLYCFGGGLFHALAGAL